MTRLEFIDKFSAFCHAKNIDYALARAYGSGRSVEVVMTPADSLLVADFANDPDLRVTFITEPSVHGLSYASAREFVLRGEKEEGIVWLDPVDQALMLFMEHVQRPSDIPSSYKAVFRSVLSDHPNALGERMIALFGDECGMDALEKIQDNKLNKKFMRRCRRVYHAQWMKTEGMLRWGLFASAYTARVFFDWLLKGDKKR